MDSGAILLPSIIAPGLADDTYEITWFCDRTGVHVPRAIEDAVDHLTSRKFLLASFANYSSLVESIVDHIAGAVIDSRRRKLLYTLADVISGLNIDRQTKFGALYGAIPYLISCFDFSREFSSANGVNCVNFMQSSVLAMARGGCGSSVLCAHRDSEVCSQNKLASRVSSFGFLRAVNTVRGIACNIARSKRTTFTYFIPSEGDDAEDMVFPNIWANYASVGKLDALRSQLKDHAKQMREMLDGNDSCSVQFQVMCATEFRNRARKDGVALFGAGWECISEEQLRRAAEADEIARIGFEECLPHLSRLLEEIQTSIYGGQVHPECVDRIEKMTPAGRALGEALFYKAWGSWCREKDGYGIGFDRDHERYQHAAFSLGYAGRVSDAWSKDGVPLIYARRRFPGQNATVVSDIGVRQFWTDGR